MNRDEFRETRVVMRRVEAHLRQAHLNLGAKDESVGMVDVIYHGTSALACLNYVTPRRNTAWVSANYIQQGLVNLREKGRRSRVRFADGLYPPVFAGTLRELGLELESETPMMVYPVEEKLRKTPNIPSYVQFSFVTDQESMAIWWYVWRNAFYDVFTSTAEPLYIGRDLREVYMKNQFNLIMYRHGFPMGAARVTMSEGSAHLVAQAIMKEFRTPELERLLREVCLDAAIREGNDLIFSTGTDESLRQLYREIGFVDSGSIVTYAENEHDTETDAAPLFAETVLLV